MNNLIETDRLRLRPFELDDAEAAHAWFGDDIVMKYTPAGPDKSIQQTRDRLADYRKHQKIHGFSKWLISESESALPIGDAGLYFLEELNWIDLGFRFAQPYWGRGLATEVAEAWIQTAFGELNLEQIGAFVHVENLASIRVLEKLRFRSLRKDVIMDMPSLLFILESPVRPK